MTTIRSSLLLALLITAGCGWSGSPPASVDGEQHGTATPPLTEAAESRGPFRVALVSPSALGETRNILDLALVELSNQKQIELVERAAIDKVLAEQKLSLAGLVDVNQLVAAGKLLGADLFAVVEGTPDGKDAFGLIVFDAATGVRLWDASLAEAGVKERAASVADGVRKAAGKRAKGAGQLRTVALLSVRNADLPRSLDTFCEGIGLILQRRLLSSPDLAVLERKRLEFVNQERALSGQVSNKALLSSMTLLEVEVSRPKEGEGFQASVQLSDVKNKPIAKVTARGPDANDLLDSLLVDLTRALRAAPPQKTADRKRESARFAGEARLLWSHKHFDAGLQAAEAAYALGVRARGDDPMSRFIEDEYTLRLSSYLLGSAIQRIDPNALFHSVGERMIYGLQNRQLSVTSDVLEASLQRAMRACELGLATPRHLNFNSFGIDGDLSTYLMKLQSIDGKVLELKKTSLNSFRAVARRFVDKLYDNLRPAGGKNGGVTLGGNVDYVGFEKLLAENPSEFVSSLTRVFRGWLAVPKWSNVPHLLQPLFQIDRSRGEKWGLGPKDYERLTSLSQQMEQHEDPLMSLYGRVWSLWIRTRANQISPEECRVQFQTVKKVTFDQIRNPKWTNGDDLRKACYELLLFAINGLTLGPSKSGEIVDVIEFMLTRKELVENVLGWVVDQRQRLHFVNQMLLLAESPESRVLAHAADALQPAGTQKDKLILRLRETRARIQAANPELGGRAVEPPWQEVRSLVKFEKHGLLQVDTPILAGEKIYVVGFGRDEGKPYLQLVVTSLREDQPRLLGKIQTSYETDTRLLYTNPFQKYISSCCLADGQIFVGTRHHGIYAFGLDDKSARRVDQNAGLPSSKVDALAVLDGKVFATLGDGYLVSFSPGGNSCDVLVSSRRKEKKSPFDNDVSPFTVPFMLADPERRRILFYLSRPENPQMTNGIWEFSNANKEFRHRHRIDLPFWSAGHAQDGQILFSSIGWALLYDPSKDQIKLIWLADERSGIYFPGIPAKSALLYGSFQAQPPHLYHRGWLWAAYSFSRISVATREQEILPPLSDHMPRAPVPSISGAIAWFQAIGEDHILVGGHQEIWLLKLKKEEPRKQ